MNKKVSIFCQNSLYEFITNSNLDYKDLGNELEVIVDDVEHLDDDLFPTQVIDSLSIKLSTLINTIDFTHEINTNRRQSQHH